MAGMMLYVNMLCAIVYGRSDMGIVTSGGSNARFERAPLNHHTQDPTSAARRQQFERSNMSDLHMQLLSSTLASNSDQLGPFMYDYEAICKISTLAGDAKWCKECDPETLKLVQNAARNRRCEVKRLMFQNYKEGRFRPHFGAQPENISVDVNVHNIGPVYDTEMVVRYDIYLNMEWTDKRFMFDRRLPHITFQYEAIQRDELLWVPTVYFPDGLKSEVPEVMKPNVQVRAFSNGTIRYSARAQLDNACMMFLGYFPLDIQHCQLCIESYSHSTEDVIFHWRKYRPVVFGERLLSYSDLPMTAHFQVANPTFFEGVTEFESGSYSKLCINIVFERKLLHYILADYLPSAMIVCLSWVSFWVSPDLIPARASLSITTVLAIITLIGGTQQRFPSVSDLKALDIYYFTCFLYVFLCLLEFAAASYRAKRMPPNKKSIDKHRQKYAKTSYVSLADIGALALRMTAVNSIDEEDELGGVDIHPPSSAFRQHNNSFGSSTNGGSQNLSRSGTMGGGADSNDPNSATATRGRIRKPKNRANSIREQAIQEESSPFVTYEAVKRLSLKHAKELDNMARVMFPSTFAVFNVVYWTSYWWLRRSSIPGNY